MIETNVNIRNELNFSDLYRSVSYIGLNFSDLYRIVNYIGLNFSDLYRSVNYIGLNFSDVYRSVNYIGLLAKFTQTPSVFIHFACDPSYLHFDKHHENEIHALNKLVCEAKNAVLHFPQHTAVKFW